MNRQITPHTMHTASRILSLITFDSMLLHLQRKLTEIFHVLAEIRKVLNVCQLAGKRRDTLCTARRASNEEPTYDTTDA